MSEQVVFADERVLIKVGEPFVGYEQVLQFFQFLLKAQVSVVSDDDGFGLGMLEYEDGFLGGLLEQPGSLASAEVADGCRPHGRGKRARHDRASSIGESLRDAFH